jgi:hypothetical protein
MSGPCGLYEHWFGDKGDTGIGFPSLVLPMAREGTLTRRMISYKAAKKRRPIYVPEQVLFDDKRITLCRYSAVVCQITIDSTNHSGSYAQYSYNAPNIKEIYLLGI